MGSNHPSLNPSLGSFERAVIGNLPPAKLCVRGQVSVITKCCSDQSQKPTDIEASRENRLKLQIGSPIIIVEAPQLVKTAASVPCLRANTGFIKPGDVGRIVSRKPKDVWAIRLSIGTYLVDGKYFMPLELDD